MNTLLKLLILYCTIFIVSCQKDDTSNSEFGELILAQKSENTPFWSENDKIKVYDGINEVEITLKTSGTPSTTTGIITDGGEAFTFKKISSWGNTLYAVYPASAAVGVSDGNVKITIPNETDGSFASANICAATTTSKTLQFKNATAIVEIKDKMTSITKMELNATNISGTYLVDLSGANAVLGSIIGTGNDVITITPSETNEGPYYAAVAPVSFSGQIATYYEGDTPVGTKTINEQKLTENTIYNIHHANRGGNGLFSVSSTTKVQFSPGNLWYGIKGSESTASFHFEDNQWDSPSSWNTSHVGHFYWSKTASVAYAETYSDSGATSTDVFFTNSEATTPSSSFTVEGQTGKWRTLSGDSGREWVWLLGPTMDIGLNPLPGTDCRICTTSGMGDNTNVRYAEVIVNGVNGLLIFPDTFTWTSAMGTAPSIVNAGVSKWENAPNYTIAQFSAMEQAGCVFLPAAGARLGSGVDDAGSVGSYWSSTPYDTIACHLNFISSNVLPACFIHRYYGYPVRLVQE